MRKDIIIIICLMLCLGVAIGCLPNNVGYLNDNLPITSPTIPMLEIEPKATVTGTSFPTPTAISTPTTIPLDTPVPTQIPTGELYIFSEPEGAVAGIASENLSAHAPVSWTMLPGTYTVTLTLEGYQEWITPINVTAGSQVTLAVTLRQQHTIIPIEGANYAWSLVWSDDGQSLTYATGGSFLPVTQSWWLYDLITHTQEVLPPLQNRVTNTVREVLGVCPFPLPDIRPYPCSPNLQESPTSNRIVFSSMLVGHDFNTWLANVDGTGAIHLETIPEAPSDVMWSNNEQWVLIGVYAAIDHSHVYYLVSSDGTFVESLEELTNTNHWRVQGVRPQFSPDGQRVAFIGVETGGRQLTAQQQDNEESYNLYVLDLNTLEYQLVSMRFGSFQWSADGNGLYILDGAANTAGNSDRRGLQYANFYYIDLTQEGYPEQKLVGDIPISIPYTGVWAYSPEARVMAGEFVIDGQGSVFSLLFLP